jgi:ABC-type transporter Mla maintaining outer membrane lipid asymmetry ATPase subunit MlaF
MLKTRDLALDAPDGGLLLTGLNLEVPPGGNLVLAGPSGCGKSRLLKVIAGTERPRAGAVAIGGVAIWPGKGVFTLAGQVRVGLAFARGGLLANLSLQDNVALPLRFQGLPTAQVEARVAAALERFGLARVAGLRPHAVSECARRFANLARVLALEPALVLLDDPLGGLEARDRASALGLLEHWASDPVCTLVITAEDPSLFSSLNATHLQLSQATHVQEPS